MTRAGDWSARASAEELARVVQAALASGHAEDQRALVLHDLGRARARLDALTRCFPPGALHAVAVKANPLPPLLRALVERGAGLECASIEEVHLAQAAGCPPERIVYDSPAKTRDELSFALRRGLYLNADTLDELSRIAALLEQGVGVDAPGVIGLRVNPAVGAGAIAITSVGASNSRFGLSMDRQRPAILDAFRRYPWLRALHVHVGSQGCRLEQLCAAAERVQQLLDAIERELGAGRVTHVDLGGGLPTAYRAIDRPPDVTAYADALRARVPRLLDGSRTIVTEFGRALQAGCGLALSRVEYVTRAPGRAPLVVIHLGADFLLRRVYHPDDWHHELLALDPQGQPLRGPGERVDVVGPLCFAGDILARALELPRLRAGDLIVVRDVGAYTLSMWSRHCSRGLPRVLGYDMDRAPAERFELLRERERPQDVVAFWRGPPPERA